MVSIVAGRSCANCTLCCKILKIDALNKPRDVWCSHCRPASGCSIYNDRPDECRSFYCGYLIEKRFGEEWKPSHSKIVLVIDSSGNRIAAHVDPQRPDAWKQEPYYPQLKEWAKSGVPQGKQVAVQIGQRTHFIMPDRDIDLGIVNETDRIIIGKEATESGLQYQAYKLHKNDPRLQTLAHAPNVAKAKDSPAQ